MLLTRRSLAARSFSRTSFLVASLVLGASRTAFAGNSLSGSTPDARPSGIVATTATLADVLQAASDARGSHVDNTAETWAVEAYGQTGEDHDVYAGDDERHDSTLGPFSFSYGKLHKQRWWRNENGLTVLEEGIHERGDLSADAVDAATRGTERGDVTLLGEVTTPTRAYVVEVDSPSARKRWLFLDKQTGLLSRLEALVAGRRAVATFDDYRKTDGEVRPWHVHVGDGRPQNDEDLRMTALSHPTTVPEEMVQIPGNARTLVEFPPGKERVDLPATFVHGYVIVRVTIGGRGLDFILDSGSSGILIDRNVVRELALPTYGAFAGETAGPYTGSDVLIPDMEVGTLAMHRVHATNLPFAVQFTGEHRVVGLLGFDFIADAIVHIDNGHGRVEAYKPGSFDPAALPSAIVLDSYLDDGIPLVAARVGNSRSHRFILDTGSGATMVFTEFALQHPDDVRDQGAGARFALLFRRLAGVGGTFDVVPTQLKVFSFADTSFQEFLAFRMARAEIAFEGEDYDGIVGIPNLHYYALYFDYRRGQVVLVPNGIVNAVAPAVQRQSTPSPAASAQPAASASP